MPVLPAVVAVTGPPNVFPSTSVSGALVINSGVATGQGVPNGTLVANVRTEPRYLPGNDPLGISGGRISTSGVRNSTDSWSGTTPTLTVQSGPPAVVPPNAVSVRPTPPAVPMPPIRDTSPPASVPAQPPIEPVGPVVQRRAGHLAFRAPGRRGHGWISASVEAVATPEVVMPRHRSTRGNRAPGLRKQPLKRQTECNTTLDSSLSARTGDGRGTFPKWAAFRQHRCVGLLEQRQVRRLPAVTGIVCVSTYHPT